MKTTRQNMSINVSIIRNMTPDFPVGIQFPWYGCVQSSDHILLNNHAHPFYEVHFVLTGEVCYICEGSRVMPMQAKRYCCHPTFPTVFADRIRHLP